MRPYGITVLKALSRLKMSTVPAGFSDLGFSDLNRVDENWSLINPVGTVLAIMIDLLVTEDSHHELVQGAEVDRDGVV